MSGATGGECEVDDIQCHVAVELGSGGAGERRSGGAEERGSGGAGERRSGGAVERRSCGAGSGGAGERRCVALGQMSSVSCSVIHQCFGSSVN